MADWMDGPAHAPRERPAGFASPRTAALETCEAPPHPADGQPAKAPADYAASLGQPALESLVPAPAPQRTATQPFDVGGELVESGWGAVHASGRWNPNQPLGGQTAVMSPGGAGSAASPVTNQWAPPPVGSQPVPVAPNSTDFTAATWLVVGCLFIGLTLHHLALPMLVIASMLPFTPVAWRQATRTVFSLGWLGIVTAWLWNSASLGDIDLSTVAQLACAIAVMTIGGLYLESKRGRS